MLDSTGSKDGHGQELCVLHEARTGASVCFHSFILPRAVRTPCVLESLFVAYILVNLSRQDNHDLKEALKNASSMIYVLRTSKLSPSNYYELYIQVRVCI